MSREAACVIQEPILFFRWNSRKISAEISGSFSLGLIVNILDEPQQNINRLSANPSKWPNTLKQFVGILPTNCASVFDHLMGLALKGLTMSHNQIIS